MQNRIFITDKKRKTVFYIMFPFFKPSFFQIHFHTARVNIIKRFIHFKIIEYLCLFQRQPKFPNIHIFFNPSVNIIIRFRKCIAPNIFIHLFDSLDITNPEMPRNLISDSYGKPSNSNIIDRNKIFLRYNSFCNIYCRKYCT